MYGPHTAQIQMWMIVICIPAPTEAVKTVVRSGVCQNCLPSAANRGVCEAQMKRPCRGGCFPVPLKHLGSHLYPVFAYWYLLWAVNRLNSSNEAPLQMWMFIVRRSVVKIAGWPSPDEVWVSLTCLPVSLKLSRKLVNNILTYASCCMLSTDVCVRPECRPLLFLGYGGDQPKPSDVCFSCKPKLLASLFVRQFRLHGGAGVRGFGH